MPPPYDPATGRHVPLGPVVDKTRLAIFQVTETDDHQDYLVCRGWDLDTDPTCQHRIEEIHVAKPYHLRGTYPYRIGQVLVCSKIRTRLGDDPGKAETTIGQPASLTEEMVQLTDDDGNSVQWMVVDNAPWNGPVICQKTPSSVVEVPAYGVFTTRTPNNWNIGTYPGLYTIWPAEQATVGWTTEIPCNIWVNSFQDAPVPTDGAYHYYKASEAISEAAWALIETGGIPKIGEIWGPKPGTWTLYPGLPGFRAVGPMQTGITSGGATADIGLFYRDFNTPCWGIASTNTQTVVQSTSHYAGYVSIHPMRDRHDTGTAYSDLTWTVYLFCAHNQDPAVYEDDIVEYRVEPYMELGNVAIGRLVATREYADEPVGSGRKLFPNGSPVPTGWVADGTITVAGGDTPIQVIRRTS